MVLGPSRPPMLRMAGTSARCLVLVCAPGRALDRRRSPVSARRVGRMLSNGLFSGSRKRRALAPAMSYHPGASDLDLTALNIIEDAPVEMTRGERLMLFSLTFALRPARYLEIGTFRGGSAMIVCAAMEA